MGIYFILCAIIQYYCFVFVFCITPALASESSFRLVPISSQWTPNLFQVITYFPVLHGVPGSSCIFPKSPGSFYWTMVFGNQDVSGKYAHYYWGILASRPFQCLEIGNILHIPIHAYTHIYICICIYLSLCIF